MKKSELYGIIGALITTILLFLLLFFIIMPGLKTPEDEGIMISFGEVADGSGKIENTTPKVETEKPQPVATPKVTPKVTVTKPTKQDVLTSNDNTYAINEQKKKDKLEKEALEQQKQEEARIAAEKKQKEQDAIDKANNSMSGLFGNGGSTGSGTTSGNNTQGNPAGSGSSGGNSWSLSGRTLNGRLVPPSYLNDVEGKITVTIRVDANGNVTSASIGSPTTISDAETRNAAINAARNTKFTNGSGTVIGSITYNFKLR